MASLLPANAEFVPSRLAVPLRPPLSACAKLADRS